MLSRISPRDHHRYHYPHNRYYSYDEPFRVYDYHDGHHDGHRFSHHHGHNAQHGYNSHHGQSSQSPLSLAPTPGHHLWERWLRGSPGRSLPADLELLHDPKSKPATSLHKLIPGDALRLLMSSNLSTDNHHQGQRSSQKAELDIDSLPFRVFNDVDASLFHGVLRGNVYLCWSKDLPDYLQGRTTLPGTKSPRIMVELSRNLSTHVSRNPYQKVLIALVHQMAHAYLIQCGGEKENAGLGHGIKFNVVMDFILRNIIGNHTAFKPWKEGCYREAFYGSSHTVRSHHRRTNGSTYCCEGDKGANSKDIEKAIKTIKQAHSAVELDPKKGIAFDKDNVPRPKSQYLVTLDSEGKPTEWTLKTKVQYPYIELHYKDYAVPFPRKDLSDAAMLPSDKSVLALPPPTTWDTFCLLKGFMKNGSYGSPQSTAWRSTRDNHAPYQSTPVIHNYSASEPPYLLIDIKVYRLATAIQYQQLQSFALGRLYAWERTRNNPVDVLEMVYYGGPEPKPTAADTKKDVKQPEQKATSPPSPSQELRKWVHDWLLTPRFNTSDPKYKTNLQILDEHPSWRDRFVDLTMRGKWLVKDLDLLRRELKEEKESERQRHIAAAIGPHRIQGYGFPLNNALIPPVHTKPVNNNIEYLISQIQGPIVTFRPSLTTQQNEDLQRLATYQHQQSLRQLSPMQLQQELEKQNYHRPSATASMSSTSPFIPLTPIPTPTSATDLYNTPIISSSSTPSTLTHPPFFTPNSNLAYRPNNVYLPNPNQHQHQHQRYYHDPTPSHVLGTPATATIGATTPSTGLGAAGNSGIVDDRSGVGLGLGVRGYEHGAMKRFSNVVRRFDACANRWIDVSI